jgi:hypothetical protein
VSKRPIRARLLDALLAGILVPPLPATDVTLDQEMVFHHNASMRRILDGAVCVEATNVARFFDDNYLSGDGSSKSAKEAHDAFWRDLKCLVPPHDKLFIEWDQPQIPTAKRMGVLFVACTPDRAEEIAREIIGEGARVTPAKIVEFTRDPRCRWIYLTLDFLEFPHTDDGEHISGLRGPYHIGTTSVAEDGSLLNFWMSHGSILGQDASTQVGAAALVAWTTLAMMNCANIDTIEHHAPDAFQKARREAGKKPLVSHHTVRVDLDKTPRQVAAEGLPGDGDNSTPRRHKKRGHMKDYRGGKGLFGRYKGVWYWGPSLAGSEDAGVVVSDYEVRP